MDFGVAFASSTESWRWVKRAEELGFKDAWFYDTQLLNPDVFICMALAAEHTSSIGLGTGVLIPSNRIAPVAANALASMNRLAPGRIKFGVGTGFTGRRTMGLKAIKLKEMEDYLRVVYGMLEGETVSWDSGEGERKVRFLNPEAGLINIEDNIPLYVSAFGEKSRRLTVELGGGWLNFSSQMDQAISAVEDMKKSWVEVGNKEKLDSVLFGLGCVLEEGEAVDGPRAMAQAGPMAAVFFHNLVESFPRGVVKDFLPDALAGLVEKYRDLYESYEPIDARYLDLHAGHLMFVRPEERPFITAELIASMTFTAGKEELRDRLRQLEEAGYKQFAIQLVEGHETEIEKWAEVFELV